MGLDERRKIKEYTDKTIPERTKELEEICGRAVKYDIAWDTFADDAEALRFLDNGAFHRINMAFRVVCADAMGKEAVQDGLTTIRVRNVKTKEDMKITMEKKTLELAGAWALGASGFHSDGDINKVVTEKL